MANIDKIWKFIDYIEQIFIFSIPVLILSFFMLFIYNLFFNPYKDVENKTNIVETKIDTLTIYTDNETIIIRDTVVKDKIIIDSSLINKLKEYEKLVQSYKNNINSIYDSLNIEVVSNYDTTFDNPFYIKSLNIEHNYFTGVWSIDILKAKEKITVINTKQIVTPPLPQQHWYETKTMYLLYGFAGGYMLNNFLGK